jgi:Ca-activated chloride channel homolog
MNIDANDPKWTEYALGEITDEKERAEIGSILAESPEMRQLVEDIRQTAGRLKRELLAEPAIGLTPAQRERIESTAQAGKLRLGFGPAWVKAVAAAVVLMISVVTFRQLRQTETTPSKDQLAMVVPKAPVSTTPQELSRSGDHGELPASRKADKAEAAKEVSTPAPVVEEKLKAGTMNQPFEQKETKLGYVAVNPPPPGDAAQMAPPISQIVKAVPDARLSASSPRASLLAEAAFSDAQSGSAGMSGGIVSTNDMRFGGPMPRPIPGPLHKGMWPPWQKQRGDFNTEAYANISDNPFLDVTQNPLSTFSIDVDTASYSNVRRFLDSGKLPPKDAVRIEELVNYFDYSYKGPKDNRPFAANIEISEAPWKPEHKLLRIGLKAREIAPGRRPNSNLVFLLDVSGSMADENKLPLVKQAMRLLVDQLTESDRVAIVVYASDTSVYLPSTSGDQKEKLRHAIERLHAGGSTNGASGIQLAYQTAKEGFIQSGVNRVILATDGDFNVGITNQGDLTRLIEEKAKSGIFLSALGFGMGNYKDSTLELLANKGRGNYAYIDNLNEAKKVLVEQINATLVSVAKDVKIQVEFNPRRVSAYRLIGYEDRLMAKEDFNDDTKQAGVIGSGHAVTALYELVPAGMSESKPGVDPLKYQKPAQVSSHADSDELLTVKIRSKEPESDKSVLSDFAVKDSKEKFANASEDFKFAASVAAFGLVLRDSPHKGNADLERALDWAKVGKGADSHGYRQEFIRLIHRAISISD